MTITAARYSDETTIPVTIVENGQDVFMPAFPSGTSYDRLVQEFLDVGGVIDPYDQYYGISDDKLREEKYNLNAELAQTEVEAAEATPVVGPTLDPRKREKENLRRNNRAKRNNKMTDADDVMADHVDDVGDVLDQADDEVENLNRAALEAWNGSTIVWPMWVPPSA